MIIILIIFTIPIFGFIHFCIHDSIKENRTKRLEKLDLENKALKNFDSYIDSRDKEIDDCLKKCNALVRFKGSTVKLFDKEFRYSECGNQIVINLQDDISKTKFCDWYENVKSKMKYEYVKDIIVFNRLYKHCFPISISNNRVAISYDYCTSINQKCIYQTSNNF